jgi:signal transduction histidine kinase
MFVPQNSRRQCQQWVTFAAIVAGVACCNSLSASAQSDIITNAAGVRSLSASEAAQARPVRLQGVVIDESDPRGHALVISDESVGIYVRADSNILSPFHRGDLLVLSGVTDPGEFAPIVSVSTAQKLGTAPIPPARPVTYHQLLTGSLDAQSVEISGVVQRCLPPSPGSQIRRMDMSVDGGPVHVRFLIPQPSELQEDAEVRVRALCFYQFNQKRQILNPVLQVARGVTITVEKPAPVDPFAVPVRSAATLLQFSPENSLGHRIHVRGVVTHSQANGLVWLRDNSSGLRLQSRKLESVRPGDIIDVLGFPKLGYATPTLDDAIYRKLGTTNPPAALSLTKTEEAFDHENDLVCLEATLSEKVPILDGLALSFNSAGTVFKGVLQLPSDSLALPDWQPGSLVRITGICQVLYEDTRPFVMGPWKAQLFQVLLRSPVDLAVLRAPPWWTLKHITYLLGIATGILGAATGIIILLARRRLHEQEQQRAMAETEFAAILSERNRLAREIHDTLAQGLTATSVQLRLARKHANGAGDALSHHLDAAQELVRGSLEEARNSIWNMRSQALENGDLPSALKYVLRQMADSSELQTDFKVRGQARRLAPIIENDLLRVGQEAITNAAKHARATQINVILEFNEKSLLLIVRDNGKGFDVTNPAKSGGGFGLVGMRERAQELNGKLNIHSDPDKGTEVALSIPLMSD